MHICVTWMSNFGVWQTYMDGAAIDIGPGVFDQKELDSKLNLFWIIIIIFIYGIEKFCL